jgi:hypothetical protein
MVPEPVTIKVLEPFSVGEEGTKSQAVAKNSNSGYQLPSYTKTSELVCNSGTNEIFATQGLLSGHIDASLKDLYITMKEDNDISGAWTSKKG